MVGDKTAHFREILQSMTKIIVIQSDDFILDNYRQFLRILHYEVITSVTGKRGIDLIKKELPDIILVQHRLMDMYAMDLCRIIREDSSLPVIPIIISVASDDELLLEEFLDSGADDRLVMPWKPEILQQTLSRAMQRKPVRRNSIFGDPLPWGRGDWAQVFVLIPFSEVWTHLYEDHILEVTNGLGLTCKRGDEFLSSRSIMQEIWSGINYSRICIVECTYPNPNVYYELGILDTIGKNCILIAQSMDKIPFDIGHRRVILYETTPEGMEKLDMTLAQLLESELNL
jgi:CheY-like chemotaxis protein